MPRHPHIADTTDAVSAYVFTALRQRIAEHPGPLYRLHIGDTWLEPHPGARAEAQRSADHPGLHRYAPVHGVPALLDAILRKTVRRTGVALPRESVQVTPGATGGLNCAVTALLNPGDEVLLPAPYWPLSRGVFGMRGAVPVQVPLYDRLGDPSFDPERALAQAITDRTAAIYLNSPNNPTGVVIGDDVAAAIARLAERHDLWVICDEVYEDLYLRPCDELHPPLWTRPDLRDRTVAIHSLSKGYGLAGARVGWCHGPQAAMDAIRAVQTFDTYCAAQPMQLGGARALDEGDEWLDTARTHYRRAGQQAADALGLPMPAGGTFLFFDASPWLPAGATDVLPFLERCLDAGVICTPGGASGDAYQTHVRVCFTCVPPEELAGGLALLRQVLGR